MDIPPKADRIEQVAFGFMASKVLFCALEFGVFTKLAKGPLRAEEIQASLKLHRRSVHDFLDALVALGMLERSGERYSNSGDTDFYLDRNKPSYIGGFFEWWNVREYQCLARSARVWRPANPRTRSKRGPKDWSSRRCMRRRSGCACSSEG